MKSIIESLKAEVQAEPAKFCSDSSEPILDTLYWHYCEDVGIETAESRAARANLNQALDFLPVEKINEIYLLAIALSAESERAAFISGVRLGVQLAMETQGPIADSTITA